tara:strand:- start:56 stop:586 length:531 start_codon:yes stop_codon:yes gene_type:complete
MYQNLVEGREVPWSLLVKDMPEDKHQDIDFIIDQLDWEKNLDPNFKDNHYLEPVTATKGEGYRDKWIVYGKVDDFQYFTAKELTVEPHSKVTITDNGAYSAIVTQGEGHANKLRLNCPKLLRFNELSEDEFFATESAAKAGVTFKNTSATEPLVLLRYFGPEVNPDAPAMGAYRNQ